MTQTQTKLNELALILKVVDDKSYPSVIDPVKHPQSHPQSIPDDNSHLISSASQGQVIDSDGTYVFLPQKPKLQGTIASILNRQQQQNEFFNRMKKTENRSERDDFSDNNKVLQQLVKSLKRGTVSMQPQSQEDYKLPPENESYNFVKIIQLANQNARYQENLYGNDNNF